MSEMVTVRTGHKIISVMNEDHVHHKVCTCEITDDDINGDGTVTFPLGEECPRRTQPMSLNEGFSVPKWS